MGISPLDNYSIAKFWEFVNNFFKSYFFNNRARSKILGTYVRLYSKKRTLCVLFLGNLRSFSVLVEVNRNKSHNVDYITICFVLYCVLEVIFYTYADKISKFCHFSILLSFLSIYIITDEEGLVNTFLKVIFLTSDRPRMYIYTQKRLLMQSL